MPQRRTEKPVVIPKKKHPTENVVIKEAKIKQKMMLQCIEEKMKIL